ncbi:MAG TPA: hypothetical protein VGJ82_08180, partial [Thermoanaerobaculia bacterium]
GPLAPEEAAARSKEMALRALALDSQLAESHVPLAAVAIFQEWNWNLAEEEVARALELDPLSDAHSLRGYILEARGRPEEAIAEMRRERNIYPPWPVAENDVVLALYLARHSDETIAEGLRVLALRRGAASSVIASQERCSRKDASTRRLRSRRSTFRSFPTIHIRSRSWR